jgi:hypothetical protein
MWKWVLGLVLVAALVAAGWVGWTWRDLPGTMRIGAGYIAKGTCSCLFVSELQPAQCARDFPPDLYALMTVSISQETQSVRASGPFDLWPATARFEQDHGCALID